MGNDMLAGEETNAPDQPHERATWVSKPLGALAMNGSDLRTVADRLRKNGVCRLRRFGVEYPDLEAFQAAHDAPYQTLDFVSSEIEVHLSGKGATIVYTHDAESRAMELVLFLNTFRESPLVEYRYVHGFFLLVIVIAASSLGHYLFLPLCFVVFAILFHVVDDAMARKADLRRRKCLFQDPRMIWFFIGAALVGGKLAEELLNL